MSAWKSTASKWLVGQQHHGTAELQLFLFPFAGGSARIYDGWGAGLPPWIEASAIELPGRAARIAESPYDDLNALADAIVEGIADSIVRPYALFGHSMGAYLAFEVARRFSSLGRGPRQVLVSAAGAPDRPRRVPDIHGLARGPFIEALRARGGTPEAVLSNAELMDVVLPMLRADFTAVERYRAAPSSALDCTITALFGDADYVSSHDAVAWAAFTTGGFAARVVSGNHFFLLDHRETVLREVVHALSGTRGVAA